MGTVFYGNFERKKALDYYGNFDKTIALDYGHLDDIINDASEVALMTQGYIDDLSKKVVSCYGGVSGGSSDNLSNSEYFVNYKIKALTAKKTTYSLFANNVSAFSKFASEKDDQVAKTISDAKECFVDQHEYIKSDWWTSIKEWFIDIKNSCPLFDAIGNLINNIAEGISSLIDELVYWYKCNGGKEIIGVCLAFLGAIAAVVLAVLACVPPICGFVAVCAFIGTLIGSLITAANAIYNICSSFQALDAINKNDPAWAKIYSDQDTIQDWLRNTDFESKELNRLSFEAALTIDVLKTVCDIVAIAEGIKNIRAIFKEIKKSTTIGVKVKFSTRLKQYIFNTKTSGSTKGDPKFWRDVLQQRGEMRVIFGPNNAKTYENYLKSLSDFKKIIINLKAKTKIAKTIIDCADSFNGHSLSEGLKDSVVSILADKYVTVDTLNNIKDMYDDTLSRIPDDVLGLAGAM